jgi:chemotaxis protein CheX
MTTTSIATAIPLQTEEMANMLFAAAREVFTSMLGSDIQQLPEPDTERSEHFDGVLSLIGLAGAVIGNGALVCSAGVACDLSSRLLMSEFSAVDEEVLDAVGEITNMIVGGFKHLLEPYAGQLQMSIPTVVFGKNIATRNSKANVVVAVRCAFPGGECDLTVRLAGNFGLSVSISQESIENRA